MTRAEAIRFRNQINTVIETLDDEAALEVPDLFLPWSGAGVQYYGPDDPSGNPQSRVHYNATLYKGITTHGSQEAWNPVDAASIWARMDNPAEEWPEWVQPLGSQDAYAYGAKVSHNDKHWISNYDGANVWEPGVYGWDEVPINGEEE